MVDTSTTTNDNTRDISTSSQSSFHWENENDNGAGNEELQRAIASGLKLMRIFEQQDSGNETSSSNLQDSEHSKQTLNGILDARYDKFVPPRDISVVINSLIHALNQSVRQNQQLKLKNMILKSNSGDVQSRYEVEENLKKQQFERKKCQLFLERENLVKRIQTKDGKVAKYKNKIIEKNREINRLMRILNEHSISDTPKINDSYNNNNNDSKSNHDNKTNNNDTSNNSNSAPNRALKPPSASNTSTAVSSTTSSTSNKEKASDMLRTLGMLASQVLNDEADEDSANQTTIQANNSGLKGHADCNTTEPEILHSPNFNGAIHNSESMNGQAGDPRSTSTGDGNHTDFLKQLPIQMPKMKRFSTVDGTVKDIE
ncbi:hypothetical protein ZYGR_0AF02660 [Zygosaccharomyces rouxii]|uniref:Uncharacterized protein n=1 Tax=Zygosaccharomyces rouxii TaxID=4956 RepID=A0A1Q3A7T8_ZYGRO|nr:hypothetical protein ZYGR_0AF02660 [Zygosaccharomyces rouxii]